MQQVAEDHGFTTIADVDIMDADGSISLPAASGKHLKEDLVGANYENYDFFVVLSHFKGHTMGDKILYISVMNKMSVDCDCDSSPAEPDMHDIGILAFLDPVALDQACVDLVYAAPDGQSLIERMESRNGIHTLDYAEEIGLGSQTYQLVNIEG